MSVENFAQGMNVEWGARLAIEERSNRDCQISNYWVGNAETIVCCGGSVQQKGPTRPEQVFDSQVL